MNKLLTLLLLIPSLSWANFDNWNCVKLEKNKFTCTTYFDDTKVKYTGDVKNSEPYGYGFYEALNWDMKGEGNWKFNGKYLTLVKGVLNAEGNIISYDKGEPKKISYSNGSFLEILSNSDKTVGKLAIVGGNIFIGELNTPLIEISLHKGEYRFSSGDIFIGSFVDNNFNEGEYTFKNGDRYVGTYQGKNEYLNGTFYYSDGRVVKVNNGILSEKLSAKKIINTSKNYLNIYSIFLLSVLILFLVFKFGRDIYERKIGAPKTPISVRFKEFWTSPIASWIFTIVVLYIVFKIMLSMPIVDERAPDFFGDVT